MKFTIFQRVSLSACINTAIVLAFGMSMSACGQKGPLYLGQAKTEPIAKTSKATASSPAEVNPSN